MKTLVMLSSLVAVGCSDDADIGVNSTPMTCNNDGAIADVSGSVKDPLTGTVYDFDTARPSVRTATTGGPTLLLSQSVDTPNEGGLVLRFGFYCGAAERERYGVRGDTQDGLDCPLQVASTVLGRIEYLPAKSGTLIVDENSNCLAGRFHVDFGSNGTIDGSFSTPWQ